MSKLGEQLRQLREKKGLTQGDLKRATGIHQPTISAIEKGTMPLVSPHLAPLAQALGVHVLNPLGDTDEPVALQGTIIPVWPQSQTARIFALDEQAQEHATEAHHVSFKTRSTQSFFTIVEDDAMEPEIRRGALAAFDPSLDPQIGRIVVAAKGNDPKAVLGRYAGRGQDEGGNPRFDLIPDNVLHPTLHSDTDQLVILGVLCETVNVYA